VLDELVEPDEPLELVPPELLDPLLVAAPPPAAAAVAALSMPPCPLQEPRPPCGDVDPSLHVTGVVESAEAFIEAPSSAAAANAPQMQDA
jgi:hypothetical protein